MSPGFEGFAQGVSVESDLPTRIAAGDRAAEAELVHRFERGVRTLVRRYCRPGDHIVDDLVQEVLTDVIERLRLGGIRDGLALPAYIRATAVYATTAEYRRRRPTQDITDLEDLAAPDENPHALAHASEAAALLRVLLAKMPVARDREVLMRFYLVEQDKEAVCRALKIEPSHFHRVVHRARERFRTLLEQAGLGAAP